MKAIVLLNGGMAACSFVQQYRERKDVFAVHTSWYNGETKNFWKFSNRFFDNVWLPGQHAVSSDDVWISVLHSHCQLTCQTWLLCHFLHSTIHRILFYLKNMLITFKNSKLVVHSGSCLQKAHTKRTNVRGWASFDILVDSCSYYKHAFANFTLSISC